MLTPGRCCCEPTTLSTPCLFTCGLNLFILVSREELENHLERLQEENLDLKNHANKKDEEMKKLGTRLKKMADDQDRLAQLVMGRGPVRLADPELDVVAEDGQQRLQAPERQNEALQQRHHMVRRQRCLRNGGNSLCSGQQKLENNGSSCHPNAPKNARRLGGGKPPAGLLEEARAEISILQKRNTLQQNRIKVMEGALELLQEQLRENEAAHEKKLLQIHKEEASKIWLSVENNVTLTNLQKQLSDKSIAVAELQERLLQMQRSHRALKANYHAAVAQMNDLLAQLSQEKEKSFQLEKHAQLPIVDDDRVHGLHQQLAQVKEERDLLRERMSTLHRHTCQACQAHKSQMEEQQLQVTQLQMALKAELVDKHVLLSKFKSEQESNQELAAEMRKLKNGCREKQRRLVELNSCWSSDAGEGKYSADEFNAALLLVKKRKNRKETESQTGGGVEGEERGNALQELQDAHGKTMQELQKSKNMLSVEREICKDFKLMLEGVTRKMNEDQARARRQQQAPLPEAQPRRAQAARPEFFRDGRTGEDCAHLEGGESLVDLQIVGARLSSSALKLLGEGEPATFCTYIFFRFDIHSTPVVWGRHPKYSFTSRYLVKTEEDFLDYVRTCAVFVELHQRLVGCGWRTVATAHLPLRLLLERGGQVQGSAPLAGLTSEAPAFGALDYCVRLKLAVTEEPSGAGPAPSACQQSREV